MAARIISKTANKVLVIGPIYDKIEKFSKIQELAPNYDNVIFNGGLCYPFDKLSEVEKRITQFNETFKSYKTIYVINQHDLLCAKYLYDTLQGFNIFKWIMRKPNVVLMKFKNQTNMIVTGGGIIPTMNRESLTDNLETSFVSNIDGKPWHKKYTGLMGYVISNNPLTSQKPKFYPFSIQLGNQYSQNVQVYAQEVEPYGLKRTILL